MARKMMVDIDGQKLKKLIEADGRTKTEISWEIGASDSYLNQVIRVNKISKGHLKLLLNELECDLEDLMPDPEPQPVQEEIKIEQYPVSDTEVIQKLNELMAGLNTERETRAGAYNNAMRQITDIQRSLDEISRKQFVLLNAIQAIGGADEIVNKIMAKQKPRQVVEAEQMLRRIFNTMGKDECQYAALYNNCKAKIDGVTLQHIHQAICNEECEIISAKGGRVIKKIVKEIK